MCLKKILKKRDTRAVAMEQKKGGGRAALTRRCLFVWLWGNAACLMFSQSDDDDRTLPLCGYAAIFPGGNLFHRKVTESCVYTRAAWAGILVRPAYEVCSKWLKWSGRICTVHPRKLRRRANRGMQRKQTDYKELFN